MPTINQLSALDALSASDLFAVYSSGNGDARKVAANRILTYIQAALTFPSDYTTQYASPAADAFSIQITDGPDSIHLILTPLAGFANGTIVLPALGRAEDGQRVVVNCTQAVAALTVDGNGAVVNGAPAAFLANEFFTLKFDAVNSSWYRVG
jgi:hypothetical protein